LENEQSKLKAQVIAIVNNTEKLDGQMPAKTEEHVLLLQQSSKLLQEMEKLRGNAVQLQIKFDKQMLAKANEQARLQQQSRELMQGMEELHCKNDELQHEMDRLQGHDEQLQTLKKTIE
jgi:hypothetical protein